MHTRSSSPESSLFLFYTLFALLGPFILGHTSIITSEHHVGHFQPDFTLFYLNTFFFAILGKFTVVTWVNSNNS